MYVCPPLVLLPCASNNVAWWWKPGFWLCAASCLHLLLAARAISGSDVQHLWRRAEAICLPNVTFSRSQLEMRSFCQLVWRTGNPSKSPWEQNLVSSKLCHHSSVKCNCKRLSDAVPITFTKKKKLLLPVCVNRTSVYLHFCFLEVSFNFCFLQSWTPLVLHIIINTLHMILGVL